jgi:hypothetical protein
MPKKGVGERRFYVWHRVPAGDACRPTAMDGFEYRDLDIEAPLAKKFPKNVVFEMDQRRPTNVRLIDFHVDGKSPVIVSKRLRELIEQHSKPQYIEFLPITIKNHKGRIASKDYFIVHGSKVIDCLDLKASEAEYDLLETDRISEIKRLALDPKKIPPDVHLFRVKEFITPLLVMDGVLRRAMLDAKLEGVIFIPAKIYPRVPSPEELED